MLVLILVRVLNVLHIFREIMNLNYVDEDEGHIAEVEELMKKC